MVLLIVLIITGSVYGQHFLLKAPQAPPPDVKVIKKVSENIYLIEGPVSEEGLILEPNYPLRALQVPNDTCTLNRWDLSFIDAFRAWDLSTGSGTVYIGIADTGVDYNHPDLQPNLYRNTADCDYDGIDDDGNGYVDDCYGVNVLCYPEGSYKPTAPGCNSPDALDDNGHGTHVAGIIGAVGNNAYLIPGILWNVKIIPCKFLNSGGVGDIAGEIACLDYFLSLKREKGLNIVAVNASYGDYYPASSIQRDKIADLGRAGILYISAAGNDGRNNESVDFYPCNYDLPNQICVGSAGPGGDISSFSHYGSRKVKILAPGENIPSLKISFGTPADDCAASLKELSGTSMATAFVTASAGLLKSKEPFLTAGEVRERILTSAEVRDSLNGKVYTCGYMNLYRTLSPLSVPKPCLSESFIDYGTVYSCGHYLRRLYIRNVGTSPVSLGGFMVLGRGFYKAHDDCSFTVLDTLEECMIEVIFDPPQPGFYSGTLEGTIISPYSNVSVPLSGSLAGDPDSFYCHEGFGCGGEVFIIFGTLGLVVLISRVRRIRFNN